MRVEPYLFFEGRCEEALAFYKTSLGAEVTALMRFRDSPEPIPADMCPPGSQDKIMHADFRIGETVLMASDGRATGQPAFQGVSLSLAVPTDAEAQRLFSALAEGGQVQMPLGRTFFASSFGMVADRFGVPWMVITAP
ncbi:MAG: VOC family protein [Pseudomonadota bacterium]|nr:VOC family protein [Pseudomonadota bacterium]